MSELTFDYRWEWHWKAKGSYKEYAHVPTEEEISDYLMEKVASKLAEKYIAKGHNVYVQSVETLVQKKLVHTTHGKFFDVDTYEFTGVTNTRYSTDLGADVGSPIDPATIALITTVIALIGTGITIAFKWYMFETIKNILYDITEGMDEVFGEGKGWTIFFLIIIVLIALFIIGRYFWRKR